MSSEPLILPSAYRHNITGPANHKGENVIEVGFEVSDTGNVVVYHAMNARPKYR